MGACNDKMMRRATYWFFDLFKVVFDRASEKQALAEITGLLSEDDIILRAYQTDVLFSGVGDTKAMILFYANGSEQDYELDTFDFDFAGALTNARNVIFHRRLDSIQHLYSGAGRTQPYQDDDSYGGGSSLSPPPFEIRADRIISEYNPSGPIILGGLSMGYLVIPVDILTPLREQSSDFSHNQVRPNPSWDVATYLAESEIRQLSLLDLEGKRLKVWNCSSTQCSFEWGDLPAGMYLVEARTEEGVVYQWAIHQ